MTFAVRLAAAVLMLASLCAAAAAQPATPLPDPEAPARLRLGPFGLRPALIVREVGYDSNVLNEESGEQGDFTATLGARLDMGARLSRAVVNYASAYEYLYFSEFEQERGANRSAEGRVDLLLGRLRPHVLASARRSHDRPTPEIDARAQRDATSFGAGLAAAAFSRTTLSLAYRRQSSSFAGDEVFRGVPLARELNSTSHSVLFGADFELSPLTTIAVHGEEVRDRFALSPERDTDVHRALVTALLNPLALISGRAAIGVSAFRPKDPLVPAYTGLVAAVAVNYAFDDESRLAVTVDRDVRHSFLEGTPYYVAAGVRGSFTRRLFGNFDGQVSAAFDRLAYEARADVLAAISSADTIRMAGAGVGLRFADDTRVAVNVDYTTRQSDVAGREYARGRLFANLTYGF